MQQSLYNITFENYVGDCVILNTLSGQYIKVNKNQKKLLDQIMDSCMASSVHKDLYSLLLHKGFIVENIANERTIAKDKYKKFFNNINYYHLTLMPTEKCNFRCPYCFESFKNGRMSKQTCDDILRFVDNEMNKYQALIVNWYGGEPLLELEIIEYLSENFKKICGGKRKPYIASITSNGYLLSRETYTKLRKCNVTDFTVTIDGLSETHNKTRILANGDGTFETIINNILEIKNKERSNLINFTIRTNYTEDSIKYKHHWEKFLNEKILLDKRFKYLPRYAWNNINSKLDSSQYIKFDFDDNVSMVGIVDNTLNVQNHMEYMIRFQDPGYENKLNQELYALSKGSAICPAGLNNAMTIGADGTLYKCQVALENESNNVGIVGSFNEKLSLWEVDSSNLDEDCVNCKVFPFCFGIGCKAKTLQYKLRKDLWCSPFENDILKKLHILTYCSPYNKEVGKYL